MCGSLSLQQPPTVNEWRDRLKLHWTELAQLSGHKLLADDRVDRFILRLCKVTPHVNSDHTEVVFLGVKMKVTTVAELVLDFVVESPGKSLPDKLDVLQLLEQCIDTKFNVYSQNKFTGMPTSEQTMSVSRKGFEKSHMQAALLERISQNDYYRLEPIPTLGKNVDLFQILGNERECFVQSVVDGKPRFSDNVFANYFAAKWFAGHFAKNVTFLRERLYSARCSVMRYLFDRILARGCNLHVAVLHDDVAGVRRLLEVQGVDADQRDSAGRTALHLAATRKTSPQTLKALCQTMTLLIDHMIDINAVDALFSGSPLLYADISHSWVAIDKLLRYKPDTRHLPSTLANLAGGAMLDDIFEHDLNSLMAFCLDNGLSVNHETFYCHLLPHACTENSIRVAALLISRGANINAVDFDLETPLVLASMKGNLSIVILLVLSAKLAAHLEGSQHALAYVNDNSFGRTPLLAAVINDHPDVVDYLIREGADLWSREAHTGRTPLHCAVKWSTQLAPNLIDAIDSARQAEYVNISDTQGCTAMHIAAKRGRGDLVRLLHKFGAVLTTRDAIGTTPLMAAVESGSDLVVKYLISTDDGSKDRVKHDFVNIANEEGRTAIHIAAKRGRVNLVRWLHEAGGILTTRDYRGTTPLIEAANGESPDVVQYIIDTLQGGDGQFKKDHVNAMDEEGMSALHCAARRGCRAALIHLIGQGAWVDSVDNKGKTPIQYATALGHDKCVAALRAAATSGCV